VPLLFAAIVLATDPGSSGQHNESRDLPKPIARPMPAPVVASEPGTTPPTPSSKRFPAHPPELAWDGKQLSITADNSTLYEILVAVRSRLGANIDVPTNASSERVAVRLGPGPAREVLSALLEGSNYNYIIMARESNQNEIESVTLSSRAVGNERDASDVRDNNKETMATADADRRTPGYSRSARPASQEQMPPEEESSSSNPQAAPSSETTERAKTRIDSNQPVSQAVSEVPVTSQDAAAVDASLGSGNPLVIEPTAVTAGAVVGPTPTTPEEMTNQLQRMYDLRQKMQHQQNQGTTTPPSHP